MARTIFVTKQYVNGQLSTETQSRITSDKNIEDSISYQAGKIAQNTLSIASVNSAITNEASLRRAQTGNMMFNPNLKNLDSSAVTNLTEAVNASVKLKDELAATISEIDINGYINMQTKVNALLTKVNQDSERINSILAGANINYDTFAEILSLISQKDAETAADLTIMRSTLEALIATKMNKVQTSTSSLEYIDANDASKKYRIVIVDGQLGVEDITG